MRGQVEQQRLIGTLLGTRSEDGSEVEIRSAYAVPHTETEEQVEVDFLYQKQMLALHLRANPREQLVGWYATAAELNTFSALIQNFYAGSQAGEGTWPHPAVHLTVSTVPGQDVRTRTYISVPVGVTEQRSLDSCSFIPVPHQLKYGEAERSGLELMASAREDESRKVLVSTDLDTLEKSIESVLDMLDRVSNYVSNVLDEEAQPSSALGQYLMNALSLAPKVDPANIERDLYVVLCGLMHANVCSNNHIQDVLTVAYLANTIRTQIDLSNRLATAALTLGGGDGADGGQHQREGGGQRGGDNRRGGRNRGQNRPTDQ
jgi:translation initiation factor 3 subunit F